MLGYAVDDAVSGIGDEVHIYGHGSAHAGEDYGEDQHQQIRGKIAALVGDQIFKHLQKTGKENTQHDLQKIRPAAVLAVNDKLCCHQDDIEQQGQIGKTKAHALTDGIGYGDDGGGSQARLGIQSQTHGQDQHAQNIEEPAIEQVFFLRRSIRKGTPFLILRNVLAVCLFVLQLCFCFFFFFHNILHSAGVLAGGIAKQISDLLLRSGLFVTPAAQIAV